MNKTYKVIWSKAKSCYIVVSELTSRVSRSSTATRTGRATLAAVMAAAALTVGIISPSNALAAESLIIPAHHTDYAAIGGAVIGTNPFEGQSGVSSTAWLDANENALTVTLTSGATYKYYYKEATDMDGNIISRDDGTPYSYWVRDGFGIVGKTDTYHPDALPIMLELSATSASDYVGVVQTGEHSVEITDVKTAVNEVNLDRMQYRQYAAITNSASTGNSIGACFYIKQGKAYVDVGKRADMAAFSENFYVFQENDFNDATGKYRFNGHDVDYENIYQIEGNIGVFLTQPISGGTANMSTEQIANAGASYYDGAVYGLNNEVLLTGYNKETGKWATVWAAAINDPNSTLESMTQGEFNEILNHLHEEDVKLSDADIVTTKVTSTDNGGLVNSVNQAGNTVPGIIVESEGGTGGIDTYITITDEATNSVTLNTGSKVEATATDGNLSSLTINGTPYSVKDTMLVSATDGLSFDETSGTISMAVTDTSGNSVTGTVDISGYVGDRIENEARNATVTVGGNDTTIEQAINNNYNTINNINNDVTEIKNDYVTNISEKVNNSWTVTQTVNGSENEVTITDTVTTVELAANDASSNLTISGGLDTTTNEIEYTLGLKDDVTFHTVKATAGVTTPSITLGDATVSTTVLYDATDDRIQYTSTNGMESVANLNDGMHFAADSGPTITRKLNEQLAIRGSANITTESNGTGAISVMLNNDIDVNSVTATTIESTTVNAETVNSTTVNTETVNIGNNITIEEGNVDMGGNTITNVYEGAVYQGSTDAINGGQLWQTNQNITRLGNRMNKAVAGAAALAALHPLDFDPDDKLSFSAGVGNYAGDTAAAIGAFYRPDERVMFSIGGTVGNGENMVNAGVSFALGKGGKVNASRVAMTHEINDLRQQVAYLSAVVTQLASQSGYQFTDMKPFPDTAENHWAYEYVAKLAAEGIIEGYPSGNFDGERMMTRYEFAAMLFRALEKGITLDTRIIDEFEPELGRLSVERIKGEQNHKNKIERVRINSDAPDRDVYGGKINVGKTW